MSGDNIPDSNNGRVFGAEVQHLIPLAVNTLGTDAARRARTFLASVGFDLEALTLPL